MIVGFKGDASRLKNLYKELGLKEFKPESFEDIKKCIAENDGNTVVLNYNEIMTFDNPTADLVEKKDAVMAEIKKSRANIFLSLTKADTSLDKMKLDYYVVTKTDTKDIKVIEEIFGFVNIDLPYSGKLNDNEYAVRSHSESRATVKTLDELKQLLSR